jgi:ribosomal protein S15P/S13E
VRIAVNELGRLRPVETKTHYTLGMYEGIHRVVRRMISPTGEASAVMDEQVDALIPSADELEEHTRAIYKDLESTFMPTLNSPRKKYPFTDRLLTWLLKIFR